MTGDTSITVIIVKWFSYDNRLNTLTSGKITGSVIVVTINKRQNLGAGKQTKLVLSILLLFDTPILSDIMHWIFYFMLKTNDIEVAGSKEFITSISSQ